MLTPPGFDLLNDPCRRHVGTPMWRRGSIAQPGIAMSSPSIHPLRRARARDAHLGCDVCDRSGTAASDQPSTALEAEGCVGGGHRRWGRAVAARCAVLLVVALVVGDAVVKRRAHCSAERSVGRDEKRIPALFNNWSAPRFPRELDTLARISAIPLPLLVKTSWTNCR